jgi:flagellar export protein FliJ
MKPFKFSLESVLMLRTQEEDAAKNSYAEAVGFYNRTVLSLEEGLGGLEQLQATLSEKRQGVSDKEDQLLYLQTIRQQRSYCDTLTQRLARADQLKEVRFNLWMEARTKTQMLERLKERHKERHNAEQARQEEKAVEDMVSARWIGFQRQPDYAV